ncbi:hypothetical protein M3Y99_01578600 [Aphelenchoides fujianensis]|nr:hypothetical protein M3Y99_01578600 [Aphelenchoides fujianensis]
MNPSIDSESAGGEDRIRMSRSWFLYWLLCALMCCSFLLLEAVGRTIKAKRRTHFRAANSKKSSGPCNADDTCNKPNDGKE